MPDITKFLELQRELQQKYERLGDIATTANKEHRDLSRRERAELQTIKSEADELRRRIEQTRGGAFNPRLAQGDPAVGRDTGASSVGPGLGREERVADWSAENGRGGDDWNAEEFRLGHTLWAMATGDRSGLSDTEERALLESGTGGLLVPEPLSAEIIDQVRNQTQVLVAGARTIPMPADTLSIPRMTGGSTANWKTEGQPVSESTQTYDRVTFTARTAVVLQQLSVELWEDASDAAKNVIENEVIQSLAQKLDLAALRGSGTPPSPKGVRFQSGVTVTDLGTNGAELVYYDDFADAVASIAEANGTANAVILTAREQATLAKFKNSLGDTAIPPAWTNDVRFLTSNQIPTALAHGSAVDASEAYIADWSTVLIGLRPSLTFRVRLLEERYMDTLSYGIVAWVRGDIQLAKPEHCVVLDGIIPTP
jgi:HK97 family phage major capsid protein